MTAAFEENVVVSFGGVDSVDGSACSALRATFSIHLNANAGFGDTGNASCKEACTTGELSRTVIRTTAEALAQEISLEAWADVRARTLMATLCTLVFEFNI